MSASAEPLTCTVDGCGAMAHGRGLCRNHYDERRYQATTGRDPEARARDAREHWIETELCRGSVPNWVSPHGNESMFATHEEQRGGVGRSPRSSHAGLRRARNPGHRPWAWWHYFAERPQHVIGYEHYRRSAKGKSAEERADLYDQYEMEPLLFLASIGELRDDELAEPKARADEARPRIGTGRERIGSGGVDRADRRRVKLLELARAAMSEGAEA